MVSYLFSARWINFPASQCPFNSILYTLSYKVLPSDPFSLKFPNQGMHAFRFAHTQATYISHYILFGLIFIVLLESNANSEANHYLTFSGLL
jgi:hypothetical protein